MISVDFFLQLKAQGLVSCVSCFRCRNNPWLDDRCHSAIGRANAGSLPEGGGAEAGSGVATGVSGEIWLSSRDSIGPAVLTAPIGWLIDHVLGLQADLRTRRTPRRTEIDSQPDNVPGTSRRGASGGHRRVDPPDSWCELSRRDRGPGILRVMGATASRS